MVETVVEDVDPVFSQFDQKVTHNLEGMNGVMTRYVQQQRRRTPSQGSQGHVCGLWGFGVAFGAEWVSVRVGGRLRDVWQGKGPIPKVPRVTYVLFCGMDRRSL